MRSLACILLLSTWPSVALAQTETSATPPPEVALPDRDVPPETHVTPPASPTVVRVGLHVRALSHVDPPSETFPHFQAQILLSQRWRDPRLAFDREEEGASRLVFQSREVTRELRGMWHPDLGIENEDGERQTDGRTLTVRHDGSVILEVSLSGRFRARLTLGRFPFDSQRFHFGLQSMSWNANKVQLEIDEEHSGFRGGNQRGSLEWTITDFQHRVRDANAPQSSHQYSRAVFDLHADRESGFYVWKLVVPLLLIVLFTWSTFWMTGEDAGTRLQRTFIALLSVVAFHHVVADHLPRIPDLTFMDATVYLAFAFTGLTMVQIIATHRAVANGRAELARRLDVVSRWAFPLSFALGLAAIWLGYAS